MKVIRVRPATADLLVRDPQRGDHIEPEGRRVSAEDYYWIRRLRDGDVVIVPEVAELITAPAHATDHVDAEVIKKVSKKSQGETA